MIQSLIINLFGPVEVWLNGEAVTAFRSNKARALLAYLAVEANKPVARHKLATLFWGDYPDAQARKSLRNVLANLRELLIPLTDEEPPLLTIDRQIVQLSVDNQRCVVDVVRFDEMLRCAATVASTQSANALLAQAVALYQDDLLAGLAVLDSPDFEEWRLFQQEVRHRHVLSALSQVTDHATNQGDFAQAVRYAQRQVQLEPWRESAHRQLMYALAAQGERSAALAQFEHCRLLLQTELGVAPDAETVALYEQIKKGDLHPPLPAPPAVPVAPTIVNRQSPIVNQIDPLPDQQLFGVEKARVRLLDVLQAAERPWLVALDGIGGIGKTTLATLLVHELMETARFAAIAWISAKQEEFRPASGLTAIGRPALDIETLTTGLLEQLLEEPPLTASSQEKQATLHQVLKERVLLVVIDNLESVADYQALVPYLRHLANPSKFLITSRFSLQSYSDIFCYSLAELDEVDALAFLRHEATVRNNTRLAGATDAQLQAIYAVVGGNPLALKLVIGQVAFLPLTQVLDNLRMAQGKRIDQLYTYIYWQAWQMLTAVSRQLFLSLPLVPNGTFAQLQLVSELAIDDLQEALAQLSALSLVQTGGELDEPRYRLHRLTETFLMNEVLQWGA
ncbi:MAG: BTAD domain-containing putative transcriptional regulator [Caldilineaceae bacterium]